QGGDPLDRRRGRRILHRRRGGLGARRNRLPVPRFVGRFDAPPSLAEHPVRGVQRPVVRQERGGALTPPQEQSGDGERGATRDASHPPSPQSRPPPPGHIKNQHPPPPLTPTKKSFLPQNPEWAPFLFLRPPPPKNIPPVQ